MNDPTSDRLSTEGIVIKLNLLHDDVKDMKTVLKDLTTAINRLAVVEERQATLGESVRRTFGAIELVGNRVTALELQAVTSNQTNDWVGKAVWAATAAAAMFVAKKVGLV